MFARLLHSCIDRIYIYVQPDIWLLNKQVGYTVTLSYTSNITLRDIIIHAAGNMAITEFQGGGGNRYQNVSLEPRGPSTPLGSNADGFHSSGMRRGPTLSGVRMRNLLDDYFNVHNTFQLVARRVGPASLLVGDYQYLAGDNTLYATQQTLSRVSAGEMSSFFPVNTFSYPPLASATIATIQRVTDTDGLLQSAHAAISAMAKKTPCSACKAGDDGYWRWGILSTLPVFIGCHGTSACALF